MGGDFKPGNFMKFYLTAQKKLESFYVYVRTFSRGENCVTASNISNAINNFLALDVDPTRDP